MQSKTQALTHLVAVDNTSGLS